jgi:hypothetical protein
MRMCWLLPKTMQSGRRKRQIGSEKDTWTSKSAPPQSSSGASGIHRPGEVDGSMNLSWRVIPPVTITAGRRDPILKVGIHRRRPWNTAGGLPPDSASISRLAVSSPRAGHKGELSDILVNGSRASHGAGIQRQEEEVAAPPVLLWLCLERGVVGGCGAWGAP